MDMDMEDMDNMDMDMEWRYKGSLQIRARLVWQLAAWRTAHHRTVRAARTR